MNNENKIAINLSLILALIMLYCRTWLPGTKLVGEKALFIILLFCICILFLTFDFKKLFDIHFELTKEKIILAFLLLIFLYSTLFYNNQEITNSNYFVRLIDFGLYTLVYFYTIPVLFIENLGRIQTFTKYVSNFGFFIAITGFLMVFLNITPIQNNTGALISFIFHPNNTSIVFTISIIASFYYYYSGRENFTNSKKYLYIISIVIQLLAQLYTFTRAGLIATFIGLLLFFIMYYRKKAILIIPFMVLSIPLFITAFIKVKGFGSFLSRFYLLIPVYYMVTESKQKLFWGYGATDSHVIFQKYRYAYNVLEDNILDPHNTYASLIMMFGIIYTVTLLIFVIVLIFNGIKQVYTKNTSGKLFFIYLVTAVISVCIQGMFDSELIKPEFYVMQYLLIILGMLYHSTSGKFKYSFDTKSKTPVNII